MSRPLSEMPFSSRRGLTLVELLVTIGIIGLLIGLLIPAVQMAREAARRVTCVSNLHQLGIALSSYATANGVLPPSLVGKTFSPHVALLPYLGHQAIYDTIDFRVRPGMLRMPQHVTVAGTAIAEFLCPSDRGSVDGRNSYGCNTGFGWNRSGISDNGVFVPPSRRQPMSVSIADVRDGTSRTVAMTEWVMGNYPRDLNELEKEPRPAQMTVFQTPMIKDFDHFVSTCHDVNMHTCQIGPFGGKGLNWLLGGHGATLYNHDLGINDHSCMNASSVVRGAWTAGSRHPHGANALFVDGHVSFINQSVSLAVWRALATRSGEDGPQDGF